MHKGISNIVVIVVGTCVLIGCSNPTPNDAPAAAPADPLPSWNDGALKESIIAFVTKTTTDGSPDFIPPADRIATFDNDGTLWAEQPVIQGMFAFARAKKMSGAD